MKNRKNIGSRFTLKSKGFKIIKFISESPSTKYECVTSILGKSGSKTQLRGYYCAYFKKLVEANIIKRIGEGVYDITPYGLSLIDRVEDK